MVSPEAQAQGLRASEIAATTRAAREAIRTAYRVVAKPSPWTTIKQAESKCFTTFIDGLQAAVDASDLPPEAKGPVPEGCLRQQCNQSTKELLRSDQLYNPSTASTSTDHAYNNREHQRPIHPDPAHHISSPLALAINCDMSKPPKVWGVCRPARRPDDGSIALLFTVDTGSNVTVIPVESVVQSWLIEKGHSRTNLVEMS
ncbi:hypothetical protein TURU_124646 [Turdus rufiventris]|nr:hypothetical protein TURU_124646 [Turdus rufiventris]